MYDNFAINIVELEKLTGEEINLNTYGVNDIIKKIIEIDILPHNDTFMKFSDNIWDFRGNKTDAIPSGTKILNFTDIPVCFQEDIKSYVLLSLLNNRKKIQSIHAYLFRLKKFLRYCYNKGIYYLNEITANDIAAFKKDSALSLRYENAIKEAVLDFVKVYSYNFKNILNDELSQELAITYNDALLNHIEANKTPHIPKEYLDKMIQLFIKTINSVTETINNRITAAALLLLSQTGLRISELLTFTVSSLNYKSLHEGRRIPYLKYILKKSIRGNNKYTSMDIFVTELAEFAFKKLIEITNEFRNQKGTDYLILFPNTKVHPVPETSFNKRNIELFISYDKELKTINRIEPSQYLSTVKFREHRTIKTITYPITIQYRVTVCTNLYEKGVPLQYIRKFMGHLSEEMEGYYVRNPNNIQEDINFSRQTIEGIVRGDLKILGNNAGQMHNDIQRFINNNNFNVEKDVEAIVQKLIEAVPIRAKLGGVCIKSSPFRECSKDYQTNELFCAYNVCPNIFHFFYMCELSYRQCKELVETININYRNEYFRQVEKECLMLGRIVRDKLLPELKELKVQINKHGTDSILINYPDLVNIIENYDEILLEANKWQHMMKALNL
ncbi:tyrosine-type recombinase/integrase [Anaerocolumna sp. AGMB13025]|uniref:tyrosine-type recombinase/integrase n=1 Tax=Anaerocolumna sp. AGMB13025 TaxID=3039116 RepID=UPI00241F1288|nr:tyrosine-type recombinase/integrase [Anaerocolumna sp. AGMB13025]WFR58255.1 tyrosine-type recombinase/integrase [Anaerocolumna sp. AGMB13025]